MFEQRSLLWQTTLKSVKLITSFIWVLGLCLSLLGCFRLEMQIEDIQSLSAATIQAPPQDQIIPLGNLKLRSDYYVQADFDAPVSEYTLSIFEESPTAKGAFEIIKITDLATPSNSQIIQGKNGIFRLQRQNRETESVRLRLSIQDKDKNVKEVDIHVRWIRSPYTWRGTFSQDPTDGRNWCGPIDPITHQCTQAQDTSMIPDLELFGTSFIFDSHCVQCDVRQESDLKLGPVQITSQYNGQIQLLAGHHLSVYGTWRQYGGNILVTPSVGTSFMEFYQGLSVRGNARWNVPGQNFSKLQINILTPGADTPIDVLDLDADTGFAMPANVSILSDRLGQMSKSTIQFRRRSDQPAMQFQNLEVSSKSSDLHFSSLVCDNNMQNCAIESSTKVQNDFHLLKGGFSGSLAVEGNAINNSLSFLGKGSLIFTGSRNQTYGGADSAEWPIVLVKKSNLSRLEPSNISADIFMKEFHLHGGQVLFPSSISINPQIETVSQWLFEIRKLSATDPDPLILNTDSQPYSLNLMPDPSGCDKYGGVPPQVLMASQLPLKFSAVTLNSRSSSPLCNGKDVHFAWTGADMPDIQTTSLILMSGVFDIPYVVVQNQLIALNVSAKNLVNGGRGYIELADSGNSLPANILVTTSPGAENFQIPSILAYSTTGVLITASEFRVESLMFTDDVPMIQFHSPLENSKTRLTIQPTHATLPSMIPFFNPTHPILLKLPSDIPITGLGLVTVQPRIRDSSCILFPRGQVYLSKSSIDSFQSLPSIVECTLPPLAPPPAPSIELHISAYNTSILDNIPGSTTGFTSTTIIHTGPSLNVNGTPVGLGTFRNATVTNNPVPH